jgi:pimeloyl-ACP methyl ester carboxylesterase
VAAGAAVVLVALAAGIAVAWHYSSAVLVPSHSDWPTNVTVESVRPGRVALSRTEDTLRPGVYGIEWRGGRAIVGAIIASDDDSVTRRVLELNGYLAPGKKVAVEADVYRGDPTQALGLPFSKVQVHGELGPMPAWLVPGHSRTWAIVVHGLNGSPEEGLRLLPVLRRAGLPTLLITYRDDLGAPASPDGLHHMGLTEWRDLDAAARFALAHGAQRLVLVGYSMGGAISTQFMEHSPRAGRVAGLVLDAPVLDWREAIAFNTTLMGLPSVAALPVEMTIGARIDADWDSLDAAAHPEDFRLPILLFHGRDDETTPIASSDEFAAALPPHRLTYFRVPEAGHTEAWNVNPTLYDRRLAAFLGRVDQEIGGRASAQGRSASS